MRFSRRVVVVAAVVFAAALPLSASARQLQPEIGLPVDLSAAVVVDSGTAKAPTASTSAAPSKNRREFVSDVAEPKSYLLMLAGLGVLGFVASRRKPG